MYFFFAETVDMSHEIPDAVVYPSPHVVGVGLPVLYNGRNFSIPNLQSDLVSSSGVQLYFHQDCYNGQLSPQQQQHYREFISKNHEKKAQNDQYCVRNEQQMQLYQKQNKQKDKCNQQDQKREHGKSDPPNYNGECNRFRIPWEHQMFETTSSNEPVNIANDLLNHL